MIRLTHDRPVRSLTFTPNGRLIAVCRRSGPCEAVRWQWDTATTVGRREDRLIAVSPGGSRIASVGRSNCIWVWEGDGEAYLGYREHERGKKIRDLTVADDGELVILDSTWLRVFRPPYTEAAVKRQPYHVTRLRASAGGRWLIAAGWSTDVYDRKRDFAAIRFERLKSGEALAFSADDSRIVFSAVTQPTARIRPSFTSSEEIVLKGHTAQVTAAVFSTDGRRVITGGKDGCVKVWEADSGLCVQTFDWELGPVTCLTVAPDGSMAAVGGASGLAVIWDLDG